VFLGVNLSVQNLNPFAQQNFEHQIHVDHDNAASSAAEMNDN
jgi:hypothetical protein